MSAGYKEYIKGIMKTVLVVEGNGHDPEALQALLQDLGYKVEQAGGKELPASEAVQSREQHFCGIYENGPLGIFRSSLDGELLSINPAGARILKYDSPQEMIETVNRTGIAAALYLDRRHRQEILTGILNSEDWQVYEEQFRCKDGSVVDCNFHLHAVRDVSGRPVELEGFLEDISERKRKDEALHFTQFAIDKTIDQAFWMTEDARLFYVNDAACSALGYSREELLQMSIPDIAPTVSAEAFVAYWQELREKGSLTFESWHRAKDGRVYPVEIRANRVVFDGKEYNCAFVADISERRRVEEERRHTNDMLRAIIETAPTAIIGLDLEGNVRHVWNPAAEKMLGWNAGEVMGRPLPNVPLEDQGELRRFREWVRSGKPLDGIELHRRRKDGTPIDFSLSASPLKDADGSVVGNIAVLVDVTERKRTEEALQLSQFMIDRASLGIFRGSDDARILFVNDYWAQNLGYTPEELCSMSYFDIDPNLTPELWFDHRQKLAASGSNTFESLHRRKDGTVFPVEITVNLLNYRGQEFSCSFARDITDRKQAEKALRQAILVLENSPAVLFRWRASAGWPVEMVSENVTQFGYTPEELLSGRVPFSALVHPEDSKRVVAEVNEHAARGEDRFQQEYRIVTKDGDIRWIDDRTVVERDAAGEISHYQGIAIDITERKRTERVITARMRLLQFAATHALDELLQATLDEAEALTGSRIGFYHLVDADQKNIVLQSWSTRTKQEFCKMEGKRLHCEISKAGVWGDCIRERRPVIHDDYAALPHRKGLPVGHAPLIRELVVPVFRGEKIVAILGVGNKAQAYTPHDVEMVSLLADLAWEIGQRKQAEEALRESERKYRSIVEHAPFGITRSTRDGKLLSVNPALASILKYDSAQELLDAVDDSSIQDLLFPKPFERKPLVEKILAGDSWHVFNNLLRCKDGSLVTCRVHSRRLEAEGGQAREFESFQENITDQIVAERALRESEEKFRVMAETSPVAIFIYQGERIVYANSALERLFGYSSEDLCQMKFWDWAHGDFKELIRDRGLARLGGENVPGQYEARYVNKAGEERCVLLSAGMIEYQGQPAGLVSCLDITERKRTEEQLKASLLEKEVLLREVHHRVKNNLQVVSSLLFLQAQKLSDPEQQTCFLESQSRICSMALAHEQLYHSKNLAEISVENYLKNLVGQLRQIFQSPEQEIDCCLTVDDIELDIEKVIPCGLLITELLSNAYKHAFVDGRTGQVKISLKKNGKQMELAVADNGVGLPADFDYLRAGTLGLQLVTALVNQLNGALEVERGGGTLFRVRFAD